MNSITIKLYFILKDIIIIIYGLAGTIKLINFIILNKICFNRRPETSLELLRKYIEITSIYYPDNIVTGRTLHMSTSLFSTLVDKYCKCHSETILEQLLYVYKEDFIRREHGRK